MRFPELHDREWLRERYVVHGLAMRMIAAEIGCTHEAVSVALARNGIPARPRGPQPDPRGRIARKRQRVMRDVGRRRRTATRETLAMHVLAVARADEARTTDSTELRASLIDLAGCALAWAERLKPPVARRERAL